MHCATSLPLQRPESIHPALWRATQLARPSCRIASTGFQPLDQELPAGGWPLGVLIELSPSQPGIGEISLLQPAFALLPPKRSIMLLAPPYMPNSQCWNNWPGADRRLFWLRPQNTADALWACEQVLKHNACAALIGWLPELPTLSLRRLHLAAQRSDTLFVLLRPRASLNHGSPAPLRLALAPAHRGLEISIVKRRGPPCDRPIHIFLHADTSHPGTTRHALPLDRPLPAAAPPGRRLPELAC